MACYGFVLMLGQWRKVPLGPRVSETPFPGPGLSWLPQKQQLLLVCVSKAPLPLLSWVSRSNIPSPPLNSINPVLIVVAGPGIGAAEGGIEGCGHQCTHGLLTGLSMHFVNQKSV